MAGQSILGAIEAGHGLWITALIGMVLNGQVLVRSLDLLLGQTSGQRQAKCLAGDNRFKIRVTAHRALLALMVLRCRLIPLVTAPCQAFAS